MSGQAREVARWAVECLRTLWASARDIAGLLRPAGEQDRP